MGHFRELKVLLYGYRRNCLSVMGNNQKRALPSTTVWQRVRVRILGVRACPGKGEGYVTAQRWQSTKEK